MFLLCKNLIYAVCGQNSGKANINVAILCILSTLPNLPLQAKYPV